MVDATTLLPAFARTVTTTVRHNSGIELAPRIIRAFETVPRHELVLRAYRGSAWRRPPTAKSIYTDEAIVTRRDEEGNPSSSTSQPSLMALMLHELDLRPGMRVLEIGAGTGYNAALMAEVVGDPAAVTTIDIQDDVVRRTRQALDELGYGRIEVRCGDGAEGAPDRAPFDRVIATAGCADISWRWVDQLTDDGIMVVPLAHGGPSVDPVVRLSRADPMAGPVMAGHAMTGQVVSCSGFMPLQGTQQASLWPEAMTGSRGTPDRHVALFEGLAGTRRAWWDFAYFLATVDRRTYFGSVMGLVDPSGDRVVVGPQGIDLWGDAELLDDLRSAYDRWDELGRPALTDWHVTLTPRSRPRPRHDPEARRWVLERPDSWQVCELPAG